MTHSFDERGNVLFLILIAVALFAALSFAVSQSTRTTPSANKEQAALVAARFAQLGSQMEAAITKMRVMNGCRDNQISFENPAWSGIWAGTTNSDAPANKTCHLFDLTSGGGVIMPRFDDVPGVIGQCGAACPIRFTGKALVRNLGIDTKPELLIGLLLEDNSYSQEVCRAYNQRNGLGSIATGASLNTNDWNNFTTGFGLYGGEPMTSPNWLMFGQDDAYLRGQPAACFKSNMTGYYALYYVVLAR